MAIVQRGSKVYATIKDLPVVNAFSDGMKFIMQSDEGTVLTDYANLSIDLDHTTFGQTFMDMVNLTGTIEVFVSEVESKIDNFQEEVDNMKAKIDENSADIEVLKFFIRLISLGPEKNSQGVISDIDAAKKRFAEGSDEYNAWNDIYATLKVDEIMGDSSTFYSNFNLVT